MSKIVVLESYFDRVSAPALLISDEAKCRLMDTESLAYGFAISE